MTNAEYRKYLITEIITDSKKLPYTFDENELNHMKIRTLERMYDNLPV